MYLTYQDLLHSHTLYLKASPLTTLERLQMYNPDNQYLRLQESRQKKN